MAINTNHFLDHKGVRFLLHLLIWSALMLFPLVLLQPENRFNIRTIQHIWLLLAMTMTVFYANYLWAVNHLALNRKTGYFILFNLLLFTLLLFFAEYIKQLLSTQSKYRMAQGNRHWTMHTMFVYRDLISYALVTGIAIAIRLGQRYYRSEAERKRLMNENLQSEISLLKYQIQPHFFFNTLNNIYVLIGKSPEEAQQAVHRLSKLMRYILYENSADLISLDKEIEFLENYNQIMKLRLTASTRIETHYPPLPTGVEVPPLLFVSLLENAYKHGISNTEPSFIATQMEIQNTGHLVFRVENSMHTIDPDQTSRSGIGLQNLQKRLKLIYHNQFELNLSKDEAVYRATLKVPILTDSLIGMPSQSNIHSN